MVDLVWYLTNSLFCDISLLHYYINIKSSIFFILSLEIYIFFWCLCIMFICNFLWIILRGTSWDHCNIVSNFINNQITNCFCYFFNSSFWRSFECICCRLFSMAKSFWLYLPLMFLLIFLPIFLPLFSAKDKNL